MQLLPDGWGNWAKTFRVSSAHMEEHFDILTNDVTSANPVMANLANAALAHSPCRVGLPDL